MSGAGPAGEPEPGHVRPLRGAAAGLIVLAFVGFAAWAEARFGWLTPSFRVFAKLFHEVSPLAALREPTQVPLLRMHLAILGGMIGLVLVAGPRLGRHGRRWWAVFCLGYAIRAACWVVGGNLPLVPGDSSHYVEVARSVYRGEGPVKHYVESFFRDYPAIREGRGALDDWATPLWAYTLAGAYRLSGVVPGDSPAATFAVAKGTSFLANLLALPALYLFARRRYGRDVGLGAMAALAVLPVHAIYAGFALRESLVALTAILAVGTLGEVLAASGRSAWAWAVAAGVCGGMAILARNTSMALAAAAGLYALNAGGVRRWPALALGAATMGLVIAPWSWATYREYGEPFYTYTKYFPYNFSWTVHHFDRGHTRPGQFYNAANAPEIVRVKVKAALIVASYSTMILSLPLTLALLRRLARPPADEPKGARDAGRLAAMAFVVFALATLANVADVTQVQQLGRYYLPVYAILLPPAVAGLRDWLRDRVPAGRRWPVYGTIVALLWANPSWAHDASWFASSYQQRLPALADAGAWMRAHPEAVPPGSRVLTWFPWEVRVTSDRTTVLFPRALEAGAYEVRRIEETIRQYGVTHILWGSFEPMPESDPETLGPYLDGLRRTLGLGDERLLYRSPAGTRHPVRLYRLGPPRLAATP